MTVVDDTKLASEQTVIPDLVEAIQETLEEIEYWHSDMLSEGERPPFKRPNGWARVYDKCRAALASAKRMRQAEPTNVRRIVACVNACEGVSTESLEHGVVAEVLRVVREICATPIQDRERIKAAFAQAFQLLACLPDDLRHQRSSTPVQTGRAV